MTREQRAKTKFNKNGDQSKNKTISRSRTFRGHGLVDDGAFEEGHFEKLVSFF